MPLRQVSKTIDRRSLAYYIPSAGTLTRYRLRVKGSLETIKPLPMESEGTVEPDTSNLTVSLSLQPTPCFISHAHHYCLQRWKPDKSVYVTYVASKFHHNTTSLHEWQSKHHWQSNIAPGLSLEIPVFRGGLLQFIKTIPCCISLSCIGLHFITTMQAGTSSARGPGRYANQAANANETRESRNPKQLRGVCMIMESLVGCKMRYCKIGDQGRLGTCTQFSMWQRRWRCSLGHPTVGRKSPFHH